MLVRCTAVLLDAFRLLLFSLLSVCASLHFRAELSPCRSALPDSVPSRFSAQLFVSPAFLFLSELSYATPVHLPAFLSPASATPRPCKAFLGHAVSAQCHPSPCCFSAFQSHTSPFQNRAEQFLSTAIRSHRSHSAAWQCCTGLIVAVSFPLSAAQRFAPSVPFASGLCNSVLMQRSTCRCYAVPLPC